MRMKFRIGNQLFENIGDYMTLEDLYERSEVWLSEDKSNWNHITFLVYFLIKYKKTYGVEYRFSNWKNNPIKTKECKDISKILKGFKSGLNMVDEPTKKAVNVKTYNYINWIFDKKFRKPKMVTGTGIFVKSSLINEFEILYMRKLKEVNSGLKMEDLITWLKDNAPSILDNYSLNDKNDLNIFKNFYIKSDFTNQCDETKFYNKIKEMGLV